MGQVRQEAHRGAYRVSIRIQPQATYTHCCTLPRHLYSLPLGVSLSSNCTTDLPLLYFIRLSMALLMRARPQILERAGDEQSKKYIAELEAA